MKISFRCQWVASGIVSARSFKVKPNAELFQEYLSRISKFHQTEALARSVSSSKSSGIRLWICDRGQGSKMLSSEDLSQALSRELNSGVRGLEIWIGDADGFEKSQIEMLKPDLRWSFGPLTLPHELAAVVASEQIYRALTILHHLPYHSQH